MSEAVATKASDTSEAERGRANAKASDERGRAKGSDSSEAERGATTKCCQEHQFVSIRVENLKYCVIVNFDNLIM